MHCRRVFGCANVFASVTASLNSKTVEELGRLKGDKERKQKPFLFSPVLVEEAGQQSNLIICKGDYNLSLWIEGKTRNK